MDENEFKLQTNQHKKSEQFFDYGGEIIPKKVLDS